MPSRALLRSVVAALAFAVSGCTCRGTGLSGQHAELVIVGPGERMSREATLSLPDVVMEESGLSAVSVRNLGVAPGTIVSVTRVSGSESITLAAPAQSVIERDAETSLEVRFAPPQDADVTRARVEHRATFRLDLTGTRPDESTLTVELVGNAAARDCYVPALLDFGEVPLGQRVSLPLVLENGKSQAATTTLGAVEGADPAFFVVDGPPTLDVAAGARVEVPVLFAPLAEREYHASFKARRAATCAEATVELRGTGSNQAISWDPPVLDFGKLPLGDTVARSVTVTNRTGAALSVTNLAVDVPDYLIAAGAPAAVPARSTATITLGCSPTALGRRPGVLSFQLGTTPPMPVRIPLACQGGGPRIRVVPTTLSFGQLPWQAGKAFTSARKVSVLNVGTPPPSPGDATNNLFLGTNQAPPLVSIVPLNSTTSADELEVVVPPSYDVSSGIPAIAGSNVVDLDVRLTPKSYAGKEAEIRIYSNDVVEPVVRVRVTASLVEAGPCALSVSPAIIPFGDQPRGATVDATITATNQAMEPGASCVVTGVELAPGSSPIFTITEGAPGFRLDGTRSRTIKVRATVGANLARGSIERAYLRLWSNASALPILVPIELRVADCLTLAPNSLDFGTVGTGCVSASKPVNAYNTCGVPLLIDELAIVPSGAPFRITSSVAIPPGGLPLASGTAPLTTLVAAAPIAAVTDRAELRISYREGGASRTASVPLTVNGRQIGVHTDTWTQPNTAEVDILFVVDDSCSMFDEQQSLATNFAAFLNYARTTTADFRIGVTTTDTFNIGGRLLRTPSNPAVLMRNTPGLASLFATKVAVGTGGSGFERPFEAMLRAVTPPLDTTDNAGFLRSDAVLAVVIVTDALEQSGNTVGYYLSALRAVKQNRPDLVAVNVVGPFTAPSMSCATEGLDDGRYEEIVNQSNGVRGDICTTDWARDLENIGRRVLGSRTIFSLTATPESSAAITVTVNGATVTNWRWDTRENAIVFTTPPPAGATIEASFRSACF